MLRKSTQMAYRIDRNGGLRSPTTTADGRLRADAHLARTGVQTYRNADGSVRREYRPDSEVFDPESLASFEALPLTDDHPPTMLTAENAMQYARGSTGENVRRDADGKHVASSLVVFDAALIEKMKHGKTEVSNGYHCDLEEVPGETPDGEKYDAIQRNIRGNHVAIVSRGRAGSARVRMDAVDCAVMIDPTDRTDEEDMPDKCPTCGQMMPDGEKPKGDNPFAKKDAEIAQLAKERDAANARADLAEKARTDAAAATERAVADAVAQARKDVAERLDTENLARGVLGPDTDGKARSFKDDKGEPVEVRSIKVDVIKAVTKNDCSGKSDAYVDAAFDLAVAQFNAGAAAVGGARGALGTGEHVARGDGNDGEKSATQKMQAGYADAWKDK